MDDEFEVPGPGPSLSKRIKLTRSILTEFPIPLKEELRNAFIKLCTTKIGGIWALKIENCNARRLSGRRGFSFLSAYADIKKIQGKNFYFGTVFLDGYKILKKYLDEDLQPEDRNVEYALCKLLTFLKLVSSDDDGFFGPLYRDLIRTKRDIAVRFAEHFFSKIAFRPNYYLDKYYPKRVKYCKCCMKDVSEKFGDTSFGELRVWHGCVDIVLRSAELPITIDFKDPDIELLVNKTITEELCDDETDRTSQSVAKTIVYSFIQKKKYPESPNFLIPSVNVSEKDIQFYFYDSQNDIFLKSVSFDLFSRKEEEEGKPNFMAIVAAWLVVNYKLFCTGVTDEIKELGKCNFFEQAGDMLPVYQNELKEGGIKRFWKRDKTTGADLLDEPFGKYPDEYCLE